MTQESHGFEGGSIAENASAIRGSLEKVGGISFAAEDMPQDSATISLSGMSETDSEMILQAQDRAEQLEAERIAEAERAPLRKEDGELLADKLAKETHGSLRDGGPLERQAAKAAIGAGAVELVLSHQDGHQSELEAVKAPDDLGRSDDLETYLRGSAIASARTAQDGLHIGSPIH